MASDPDIEFDLSCQEYQLLAVICYIENQTPSQLVNTYSRNTSQAELEWAAKQLIDHFTRYAYA